MLKRAKYAALSGLLVLPIAAFTLGGWATITVEDLPEYAIAGSPMEISYSVRQHGMDLLGKLSGTFTATSGKDVVTATPVAYATGKYRATVTIPQAGEWKVGVHSGFMASRIDLLPMSVVARGSAAPAPMAIGDRGRHLFVAKGCVSCHSNQLTKGYASNKAGPDLSEPKFAAAYLTRFLADPSVKTTWANSNRMPNLELKPVEIAALVAFLNHERVVAR